MPIPLTDPFLRQQLLPLLATHGFVQKSADEFEKVCGALSLAVRILDGERLRLLLEVGVLDPFWDHPEPIYALCFTGEVCRSGVRTMTSFRTVYSDAEGHNTANPEALEQFGIPWLARFSDVRTVANSLEEASRVRKAPETMSIRSKIFTVVMARVLKTGKPRPGVPPLYLYLESLLHFHLREYTVAATHARNYCLALPGMDPAERRKMERLIAACNERINAE